VNGAVKTELAPQFPPGMKNAFMFAGFNALSFQIILSSPMVLYAKSLGASATVLGIIAGMMPLLVIFQIPAAQYLNRFGYKRFVLAGWSTRIGFIFCMMAVPLLLFLDSTTRLSLLLLFLFAFNLSRGISSGGWLPWITSLVPEMIRGKYLAIEAVWVNVASFVTLLISALCIGHNPHSWQFTVLFAFSGLMGVTSLVFLKRIPEVEIPEEVRTSKARVPWREIAGYEPFRKLLRMVAAWSVAYGGLNTFTIAFLKVEAHMPESEILVLNSISYLGGLSSLWFLGARLDHLGSKPVLTLSFVMWILILLGWLGMAAKLLQADLLLILLLQFLMGLFTALANMANTRLAMAIIPPMGRNHFFALYSVVMSLALGLSPILWGLLIDALRHFEMVTIGLDFNRYSYFFAAVMLVFVVAVVLSRRLHEPKAASMEFLLRELLIQSPQRFWFRLWPRA
jgi:MFS family permease